MGHVTLILAVAVAALVWWLEPQVDFAWDDRMTWALILPATYVIGMLVLRDKD